MGKREFDGLWGYGSLRGYGGKVVGIGINGARINIQIKPCK